MTVELAYAAGVIDGEGHFGSHRRKNENWGQIQLSVTQCSNDLTPPEMLVRLQDTFGFGAIYRCHKKGIFKGYTEQWEFRVWTFEHVHTALRVIWPYLGRVKRRQAVRALRSYRTDRKSANKPAPITH